MDRRPPTVFCDIDGTLVVHSHPSESQKSNHKMEPLNGTVEKLIEWEKLGCKLILTTGRKESSRRNTEKQLQEAGIVYDSLIMGIGGGKRFLINDRKSNNSEDYAIAINLNRDEGIKGVTL